MTIPYQIGFFFTAIILFSFSCYAGSSISNVGGAKVVKGQINIDSRFGYSEARRDSPDDERLRMRQHIDYGVSDWYALRLVFAQDNLKNDNLEHSSISFEQRFQLFDQKKHGFDGGFRLIYTHADHDKTPHGIGFRLLASVDFRESLQWRYDTAIKHDIGENAESGLFMELRNQVTHKIPFKSHPIFDSMRLGAEMLNDFGRLKEMNGFHRQDHQFGPLIKLNMHNDSYLQLGYRVGISSDAPDQAIRLFLGARF